MLFLNVYISSHLIFKVVDISSISFCLIFFFFSRFKYYFDIFFYLSSECILVISSFFFIYFDAFGIFAKHEKRYMTVRTIESVRSNTNSIILNSVVSIDKINKK